MTITKKRASRFRGFNQVGLLDRPRAELLLQSAIVLRER
jgi:hypothetical protein